MPGIPPSCRHSQPLPMGNALNANPVRGGFANIAGARPSVTDAVMRNMSIVLLTRAPAASPGVEPGQSMIIPPYGNGTGPVMFL